MKLKKFLLFVISVCVLLTLAACGEKSGNVKTWYLGSNVSAETFSGVEDEIDPEKMYQSIEYNEKMLYGRYFLNNEDKELDDFRSYSSYFELEYAPNYSSSDTLKTATVTELPYRITAGPSALSQDSAAIRMDRSHDWAILKFATENGTIDVICSFTVSGNKVKYVPLDYYEEIRDENFKLMGLKYTLGEDALEYEFSIKGPYLTLSKGDQSVSFCSYYFSDNTNLSLSLSGYATLNAPVFDGISYFSCSDYGSTSLAYAYTKENQQLDNFAVKLTDNGLITVRWTEIDSNEEETVFTRQFLYFDTYCGLVLVDKDENIFYYYESSTTAQEAALSDGLSIEDSAGIGDLSDTELEEIVETKENLLNDLKVAFEQAGISVQIDAVTGEMAVESSVLFGGDSAVITDSGKEFLQKFISVYTSIIYNDKYDGFISKTMIEGHTAPVSGSTYESGLPLSEERANNVKSYCISADIGVDTTKLAATLEAVGYSNSRPVYDNDGNVDMAASRRVSFKFIVNIGK